MKHLLTTALVALALSIPSTAFASGLGKFVGGAGNSEWRDCQSPSESPDGGIYKLRSAALFGWTRVPAEPESSYTLYMDAGWRFWGTTTGCQSRSGLFGSRNWSWHSLSLVASTELNFSDIEATTFAPQLAWEVRRETKGGLFSELSAFAVGFGASAGPFIGPRDTGVTGAFIVRALLDFRFAANWSFEDGFGWSIQMGFIDPHITIWRLFFEDDD